MSYQFSKMEDFPFLSGMNVLKNIVQLWHQVESSFLSFLYQIIWKQMGKSSGFTTQAEYGFKSNFNFKWETLTRFRMRPKRKIKLFNYWWMTYIQWMNVQHWEWVELRCLKFINTLRVIKTHYPISFLPKEIWTKGVSVIYIVRNLKDLAVSLDHMLKNDVFADITMDDTLDIIWKFNETWIRSFFSFNRSWFNFLQNICVFCISH